MKENVSQLQLGNIESKCQKRKTFTSHSFDEAFTLSVTCCLFLTSMKKKDSHISLIMSETLVQFHQIFFIINKVLLTLVHLPTNKFEVP